MKLEDFENKNIIHESIWYTVALLVVNSFFLFAALITDMLESEPLIFWCSLVLFGLGFIQTIIKLLNPNNIFIKPGSKKAEAYHSLQFEKEFKQKGVFNYHKNGFTINIDHHLRKYNWDEISALFGYKLDNYTTDSICLDIFIRDGESFNINEETPGWFQFLLKSKENIDNIPKDWEIEISTPVFETKHTLLYDKKKRTQEEALNEFYSLE